MNAIIKPVTTASARGWQVRLGKLSVTFRSEQEARQFASTLEARLQAPHSLPFEAERIAS
jgi:hypothetical protein